MRPIFEDFAKANKRLEEALSLKNEGVECYSPKSCFQTAFQLGLIEYDEAWLEMIEDRNKITHTYEEKTADEIYSKLDSYLKFLKQLSAQLSAVDKKGQEF